MTESPQRWDDDERGIGIGDGAAIAPDVAELLDILGRPGWVAEEPDLHLLPHLRRACDRSDSPWSLVGAELRDTVYVVDLVWRRPTPRLRDIRAAVYALLGEGAESTTFVRQRLVDERIEYGVVTGMLDGDGLFAAHGHVLLVRVGGSAIDRLLVDATAHRPPKG